MPVAIHRNENTVFDNANTGKTNETLFQREKDRETQRTRR